MPLMAELRPAEPIRRKFLLAVGHISSTEHAEREHLLRGQLRPEPRIKVPPGRLRKRVAVVPLHKVVHDDAALGHADLYSESRGEQQNKRGDKDPELDQKFTAQLQIIGKPVRITEFRRGGALRIRRP